MELEKLVHLIGFIIRMYQYVIYIYIYIYIYTVHLLMMGYKYD
jgi:hypothetical protein